MEILFQRTGNGFDVSIDGVAPTRINLVGSSNDSAVSVLSIPPHATIIVDPDEEALVDLLLLLTPDDDTLELLLGTDESFITDDARVFYGESTGVTINGEPWSWLETAGGDDDGAVLIPGDIRSVATFRLWYGPSGDPGRFGVVHHPPVSIFREQSIDDRIVRVVYGLSLRDAIEESITDDEDMWIENAPWCPACDWDSFIERDVLIPEVFDVKFDHTVDTSIISDVITRWWEPCAEHVATTVELGGRTFQFAAGRWTTSDGQC